MLLSFPVMHYHCSGRFRISIDKTQVHSSFCRKIDSQQTAVTRSYVDHELFANSQIKQPLLKLFKVQDWETHFNHPSYSSVMSNRWACFWNRGWFTFGSQQICSTYRASDKLMFIEWNLFCWKGFLFQKRNKYTLFQECHIILGSYITQCIGGTFLNLLLRFWTTEYPALP